MSPRVTVLMTVYNGLPYLREAAASVLAQTFADFEFLIIEDASTDGSAAYLQGLRDPRIRLIRNERNLGQAASLQHGMELAQGPLIARLDQDDICLPDRLAQQVALFDARPDVAVAGTWLYDIDAHGRRRSLVGMRVEEYGAFLGALLTCATPVVHPTVMFRRDAVAQAGGYQAAYAPCEDYALWCQLALQRRTGVTIPRPLMMVRSHAQQQSRTRAALQQAKARQAHDALVAAVANHDTSALAGAVLRLDEDFWAAHGSARGVQAAVQALDELLQRSRLQFALAPSEAAQLERRISWWLARGAVLALLQGRRHTAPLYRRALRGGIRMARYPAMWVYPAGWLLSPLWRMGLGRRGADAILSLSSLKYAVRLLISRLQTRKPEPSAAGPAKILYLSYDGMMEPLGESQVLGYLEPLADRYAITIVSYEKPSDLLDHARRHAMAQRLRVRGIRWIPLRYHRWPSIPATGWDVLCGLAVAGWLCRGRRIDLIHARGYVASVIAAVLQRLAGPAFLFDMRGFWPEEKVEAGHWRRTGLAYRMAKRWERRFFERAEAIVSLTEAGARLFERLGYRIPSATAVRVIPTCADLARFVPGPKDPAMLRWLGLEDSTVIGCVGTLSNWYLREPTLACLARLARRLPRAKVLFISRESHAALRQDALAAGLTEDQLVCARAEFSEMPEYLRLLDLAVFFISPTFSKQGSAATKLGELLASGIPVVINDGVGDSGRIVRASGAGTVLPDVGPEHLEEAMAQIQGLLGNPEVIRRCREAAERHFDLRQGVMRYEALYELLCGRADAPSVEREAVAPVTG